MTLCDQVIKIIKDKKDCLSKVSRQKIISVSFALNLFFLKQNGDGEWIEDGDDENENCVFFQSSLSLKPITVRALKLRSSSEDKDDKDAEDEDWKGE